MSNPTPRQSESRRLQNRFLVGAFILVLLLLLFAARYLLHLQPPLSTESPIGTSSDVLIAETVESAGSPEGIPEEEAPGTPTPGFTDDFENGLAPVWTVHFGDPILEDGRLTSHVGAGLAAGDPSWENYQVEFDVDTSQNDCTFADTSNSIGVRVQDFDHAYWFIFNGCEAAWSPVAGGIRDGALSILPDTTARTSSPQKHIVIKVEENKMSAYENGTLLSSIIDTQWKSGGIFLQVEAQTYYDNFQVTLLP